jgi:glycosyltransferase involved in cell wall biosynthesis
MPVARYLSGSVDRSRDVSLAATGEDATVAGTPLSVVTVLYGFAPGGVERVAARLHAAWLAAGIRSQILVADSRVAPPIPLDHVRNAGEKAHGRGIVALVLLIRALRRCVREDRPDVLFCAGNTYTIVAVLARLVLGRDCPPIIAKASNCFVRHDMPPLLRWGYHRWLRVQGRWIDHFVGLAPAMHAEIAHFTGVGAERITVIEDPALGSEDLARLAAARDATTRPGPGRHFLAVGRLAPQKNFALLLDAFARIADPDDRLAILGEGVERGMLEMRARSLGIAAQFCLPGHVVSTDQWLARADALVLSSDYEGVPAVLVEGLAAGLPMVATRCCVAMDDLLGHGRYGRVVPAGDAVALADAMAAAVRGEPASVIADRRAAAAAYTIDSASPRYANLMRRLALARSVCESIVESAATAPALPVAAIVAP